MHSCIRGKSGTKRDRVGTCVRYMRGRPLVIEGKTRLSKTTSASGWQSHGGEAAFDLEGSVRQTWAQRLRDAALEEHASIPAFARTLCELAALGAPSPLISRTQDAIADEIRHTQVCLEWASRLDGLDKGPGALPEAVAPFAPSEELAARLMEDVFRGGCIGETLAAHALVKHAAECPVAELSEAMTVMAADEARHAALAFDTVAWLASCSTELRQLATSLVDDASRSMDAEQQREVRPLLDVLKTLLAA